MKTYALPAARFPDNMQMKTVQLRFLQLHRLCLRPGADMPFSQV